MTEQELLAYCRANGVPHDWPMIHGKSYFRILDMTQLPGAMRGEVDERGLFGASVEEPMEEEEPESAEGSTPKHLRGPLPDGFPGKAAFEAAGYTTYAKVRAVRKTGTKVENVGDKIGEAVDAIFAEEQKE